MAFVMLVSLKFDVDFLQRYSSWFLRLVYSFSYGESIFLIYLFNYLSGLNQGVTSLPLKGWPLTVSRNVILIVVSLNLLNFLREKYDLSLFNRELIN